MTAHDWYLRSGLGFKLALLVKHEFAFNGFTYLLSKVRKYSLDTVISSIVFAFGDTPSAERTTENRELLSMLVHLLQPAFVAGSK